MNRKKQEIVKTCGYLYQRGMVTSTEGNVSVREKNRVLITPSGKSLRELTPEMIVESDLAGNVLRGEVPSKEMQMHLTIYKVRIDINAVIHTHSPYSTCVASMMNRPDNEVLPALTPGFVVRVGRLNLVRYYMPGSSELCRGVVKHMKSCNAVLLQNHGLVAAGKDLEQALNIAEEVEQNAQIYILANRKARNLSSAEIRELLDTFGK